jgi:hypothetical protein
MAEKTGEESAEALAPRLAGGPPEAVAADAPEEFARRLGRRRAAGAPVRNLFVADDREGVRPPMAQLLSAAASTAVGGGGRGGQLRLKLYLSLLWICAAPPHEVVRPARAWAALLGLDDPAGRGARRVQDAMRDLQERRMIIIRNRGSAANGITPLIEWGTGQPYSTPSEAYNHFQLSKASSETLAAHRYFRVPSSLWTSGLISRLGGPGLAMLLVLRCEQQGDDGKAVWFSPDRAINRFGLAESTRRQGLEQLRNEGLVVSVSRKLSDSGDFIDVYRRRLVHTLTMDQDPEPGAPSGPPTLAEFFATDRTLPA